MKFVSTAVFATAAVFLATPVSACQDFIDAINLSKRTDPSKVTIRVEAYVTRHTGKVQGTDQVWFARGPVEYTGTALGGALFESDNANNKAAEWWLAYNFSRRLKVEIRVTGPTTGQIGYEYVSYNGKPLVGSRGMQYLTATCIGGRLLTATSGNEIWAVGVSTQKSEKVSRVVP